MLTWQKYKEMETKKKVLYAIILILILLILILGGYWVTTFIKKSQPQPVVNQPVNNAPVDVTNNQIVNTIDTQSLQLEKAQQQQEKPVSLIAEPFVERFGSYNNQGGFSNFVDIESYMTASLKSWVNKTYIPQLEKSLPPVDTYFAINTKVISTTVDSIDEKKGEAVLIINTQRQEVGANNVQTRVYYQPAKLNMVKVGTEWKVDALFWQ